MGRKHVDPVCFDLVADQNVIGIVFANYSMLTSMQHCLMGAEALCDRPIGRPVPWTLGSVVPGHVHRSCKLGFTLERLPRLIHRPIFA